MRIGWTRSATLWSAALCLAAGVGVCQAHAQSSRWPGDRHGRDILREYDGRLVGGLTFAPAVVGDGFNFDGVDDAVCVPDVDALRITGSLRISAWVKVLAYPPGDQAYGQIVFR